MARTTEPIPRRPIDRLEDAVSWLLMAAVLGAGLVGIQVYGNQVERSQAEQAARTQVVAVLLEDAITKDRAYPDARLPVRVDAQWTVPDGTPGTGEVLAPVGLSAGDEMTVWIDESGRPVTEPIGQPSAAVAGVFVGLSVLSSSAMVIAVLWMGFRWLVDGRNARYWEREWARVEPQWRRGEDSKQG